LTPVTTTIRTVHISAAEHSTQNRNYSNTARTVTAWRQSM